MSFTGEGATRSSPPQLPTSPALTFDALPRFYDAEVNCRRGLRLVP
jgi:hypothetical protein